MTVYLSFKPDATWYPRAVASTDSEAMKTILGDFPSVIHAAMGRVGLSQFSCEEDLMEAVFGLLPTNIAHDEIEDYPADDFFVRAVQELEQPALSKDNLVSEHALA